MENNFQYYIEYDYDRTGCICSDLNDYCRCTQIINTKITEIKVDAIINAFKEIHKSNSILTYCIDRLCRINKVYDPNSFQLEIREGYYGQEINSITFNNFSKIESEIKELGSLNHSNQILYVLNLEYGHLLPGLRDLTFSIKTVNSSDCIVPNETYIKKVKGGLYNIEHEFPLGVYIKNGKFYRLLDGYHRYVDLILPNPNKEISVIVGE
jgi:hypothetical protein